MWFLNRNLTDSEYSDKNSLLIRVVCKSYAFRTNSDFRAIDPNPSILQSIL